MSGIGSHQSARAGTVTWLTPPEIIHALGPWTTTPIDPAAVADAVGSNDRVVVLGVWIGPSQTTVIDATLQELGFVRTSGLLQDYTVTVWERPDQE